MKSVTKTSAVRKIGSVYSAKQFSRQNLNYLFICLAFVHILNIAITYGHIKISNKQTDILLT